MEILMTSTAAPTIDWHPLEANVPVHDRPDYMHMGVCGTVQMYKHRDTRRYLNIDVDCVRFFVRDKSGELVAVDRETAFLHVYGPDVL